MVMLPYIASIICTKIYGNLLGWLVLISKENSLLNVACMWQILNYLCKQNHMSDFYTLWYERSVL